tara:strand:+ start:584 stop:889 length:306 start_codon:yes stop_codon:yes gene_type:complete
MYITIDKIKVPAGTSRYRISDSSLLELRRAILVKSEKTREVISGVTHITQVNYWTSKTDWDNWIITWNNHAERVKCLEHMKSQNVSKTTTNESNEVLREVL